MILIELTKASSPEEPILINPKFISSVYRIKKVDGTLGDTRIMMSDGNQTFFVKETIEELQTKIKNIS